jgi:D-alanine-D-alanine ligase
MKPLRIKQAADFGRVAVLMGGAAAEREISLISGAAVFQALSAQGIDAVAVDVNTDPLTALAGINADRVFNIIHGRGGEDGVLQAVLEVLGLPYTGSGVLASALSMDKLRTKLCWQGMGLPTPRWFVLNSRQDIDDCIASLGFPVIVKPAMEGSSIGMSKAGNREELVAAWQVAAQYNCEVYAEQWVQGREYTLAVLDGEALPVIALETPNTFYDFEAKYHADTTRYHCPCGLSPEREQQLQDLALQACQGIGVKGWGRVDMFIDDKGGPQLIEVNTIPGMTSHSLVPMAANAAGVDFPELVWRILETSVAV